MSCLIGALAAGTNPIRPLNGNVAPTNQNYIRGNIPMATGNTVLE